MTGDEILTELIKLLRQETTDEVQFSRVGLLNLTETTLRMRIGIRDVMAQNEDITWEAREKLAALLKIEVPE